MFVAISQYLVGLDEVDPHRDAHKAWLADQGERIVVSGRQTPPDGGVIVFEAEDRAAAEALIATDPYVAAGVARYAITQFG
ncbi:MAG: YciI family protein [Solirubrobacteraceae bacterium]